jgi:hypothetical protein
MIDVMKKSVTGLSQLMRSAAGNVIYSIPDIQKHIVQYAAGIVRKHMY